jgi:hypothetical protein
MNDPTSNLARAIGELSALLAGVEAGNALGGEKWPGLQAIEDKLVAAFGRMVGGSVPDAIAGPV